jgi:Mg/Co/Ni transporter MgtE
MLENQLQAVAVVNQAQRLLGILTEDELLRAVFSNG